MMHNGRSLSGERWFQHCPCCKPRVRRNGAKRARRATAGYLRRRESVEWRRSSLSGN